jgi:hypothetical protein
MDEDKQKLQKEFASLDDDHLDAEVMVRMRVIQRHHKWQQESLAQGMPYANEAIMNAHKLRLDLMLQEQQRRLPAQ